MNIDGKVINPNIGINGAKSNLSGVGSVYHQNLYADFYQKYPALNNKPSLFTIPTSKQIYPQQLLKYYAEAKTAQALVDSNPVLMDKLKANGLQATVIPENITSISSSHLQTTTAYALQIANKMNLPVADKKILEQACVFHDFGKILIPAEILNKPGELTPEEKKIMDMHADFGYELLQKTNLNKRVLELVKNHHMPQAQNNDVLGQILSVADIYSALREQRSYKAPLSQKDAMKILDQKAKAGEVSTEVVNTLKSVIVNSIAA